MKRTDAQKAIDEAFADGLKHLFGVLVQGLQEAETREGPAESRFIAGLAAHAKASAAIDKIFPE